MDMSMVSVAGVAIAASSGLAGVALYVIRSEMRGDVTRIDGRINAHEASCEQRQKNLDERHAAITKALESIDGKLDRIVGHGHGV